MNRRRLLYLVLIGLGLIVSGYLLFRTFVLWDSSAPGAIDLCYELLGVGCDETLRSASSWFLKIPLAGWGIIYYMTLLCLTVLGVFLREDFELEASIGSLLLVMVAAFGSLALAVIILTGSAPFCPLCFVIHAINLALVPVIWLLTGRSPRQVFQAIRTGGVYVLRGETRSPREARWKVLGFITTALFIVVLYQWFLVEGERIRERQEVAFNPEIVLDQYESALIQDVPVGADDPLLGSLDHPVRLVLFSNFQCPGCRLFSSDIYHLASQFSGVLTVVFKHYPGRACIQVAHTDQVPRVCQAAWATEAARLQGKFWPFHDALFAVKSSDREDSFGRIARDLDLDLDRFETDWKSQATKNKVKSDIELGISLGIDATPTLFLNGRQIRNLSLKALELLIVKELESQSSSKKT